MFNKVFIVLAFFAINATTAYAYTSTLSPQENKYFGLHEKTVGGKTVLVPNTSPLTFLSEWLYPSMLAAAALLAVIVITIAGFKRMLGAVSPSQVGESNSMITSALFGLGLALVSWLILYTINPALVTLKSPSALQIQTSGILYRCDLNALTYPTFDLCSGACLQKGVRGTCSVIEGSTQQPPPNVIEIEPM